MNARTHVLLASAIAVLLTGCSSPAPSSTATSSLNPTASPTGAVDPTSDPGATRSPDLGFTRRDPGMTSGEALDRMVHPATGESWFSEARTIPAPGWAAGDSYLGSDSVAWYELGTRDGRTIIGLREVAVSELFERDASGAFEWIAFPSARTAAEGAAPSYGFDAVPTNATVYYDSLTFPDAFTLPSGEPLVIPERDFGTIEFPGNPTESGPPSIDVDSVGDYTIVRVEEPVAFVWPDVYDVTAPTGLTYADIYYLVETPYGMLIPLVYYPVGQLADISWTLATTVDSDGSNTYLADLNDIGCGERDHDHNTAVTGIDDADWFPAGTTTGGDTVFVANISNPLAQPMYDSYAQSRATLGDGSPAVSIGHFLDAPGLLGYASPDTGDMFVYLNGAYSGRSWC